MGKVILVSNRLPVSVTRKAGELHFQQSVGGVAVGLASLQKEYGGAWIGWPGIAAERVKDQAGEIEERMRSLGLHPVFLGQREVEQFYYGFCNRTIWPLFHYFTHYTVYSNRLWEVYVRVNRKMAEAVAEVAKPGDTVWVNDYQFMLLPGLLRKRRADLQIGFFLHIPFPSFEVFRLLPWREEIMQGMMGADLIGFHTYDYVRHFLSSTRRLLGYENTLGLMHFGSRVVKADAFPMGIDYGRFAGAVSAPEVEKQIRRVHEKVGNRKIVLSIDRLDYTKGIPERLEAFGKFLADNPEFEDKVTMIMVAVPSRTRVEHYMQLKMKVDELVGRINGRHGTLDWMPVWYLFRSLPFNTLSALYRAADVALVTPMRDGMNLIAKEFIASKPDGDGVLILSELAGAANVLGEALIVNPNNRSQMVEALKTALSMSPEEKSERMRPMQRRLRRYDLRSWGQHFLDSLTSVASQRRALSARSITDEEKSELRAAYASASSRLILLDYDGTLVPFRAKPSDARPDADVIELLRPLTNDKTNEVVIVSGRDKETLSGWFEGLDVGLIAEHGVWAKERGGAWSMIEPLRNEWKEEVRPFLDLYVDRTPGSFLEEKEFSLVWHYRRVEPDLGARRAIELKDELLQLTANLDLGVLEGSKVVEVKNTAANKGKAAMRWVSMRNWDFILAIGDDFTDEDVFVALPAGAYSIRVNLIPSQARFNIESYHEVRNLLSSLTSTPPDTSILSGRTGSRKA
jgi:trehalose 6-phosphate synthase/phosphatase